MVIELLVYLENGGPLPWSISFSTQWWWFVRNGWK